LAYATSLDPDAIVTAGGASVTINNLDLGYYLVYPEGASGKATGEASICSLDSTLPRATINAKAVYPTVDKEIVEGSDRVNVSEASIGDTITYEITSTVPDYTGYKWYKLVFADTLAKGLTYGSLTSITIGNTTLNDNAYTVAVGNYDATNGTSIRYIIKDIVAANYTAGDKITITYTATLNENAVINGPNKNTVVLEYTNDPKWTNDHDKDGDDFQPTDPKGVTPVDETETYTTAVKINKTDGKSNALTGAEFQITGDGVNVVVTTGDVYVEDTAGTYWKLNDGTYTTDDPTTEGMDTTKYASQTIKYKKETQAVLHTKGTDAVDAKAFVDANGELIFQGLGIGTYTISETVVPAGYNKAEDVVFTLTFDANNKVFISDNNTVTLEAATNMFKTTIVNNAGAELPSTGGIGTTIFYIVGGVMVAGAVVFLLTKRRVAGNE
jgi:fimbrial isopeptide formation D2 family protein/LPXTG-motif cell wall-anchored protein